MTGWWQGALSWCVMDMGDMKAWKAEMSEWRLGESRPPLGDLGKLPWDPVGVAGLADPGRMLSICAPGMPHWMWVC